MSKPMNTYVPKLLPKDLLWYKRDGLMIWYDQCKCEDFLRDTNQYFNQAKIINFDVIRRECNVEEVTKDLFKHYQTLNDKIVSDN